MGRQVRYVFTCDAEGAHVGDTADSATPVLPSGWAAIILHRAQSVRRFHTRSEAADYLAGTVAAPVVHPIETEHVFTCDYPEGHPGGVEADAVTVDDGQTPEGWVEATLLGGAPGYFDTEAHAEASLGTTA